jgi:hypothetical protein
MPPPSEGNFLESSPQKPKTPPMMSLAEMYNLNEESSPPNRIKYKCKKINCGRMAVYAHNEEPDDAPVLCTIHGKEHTWDLPASQRPHSLSFYLL